jgi:hypothetical protein
VKGRWHDQRHLSTNTRLITVPAVVLRDQTPEHAVEPGESGIVRVKDVLDVIEEPFAYVFEPASIVQVPSDHALELVYERLHDASL